MVENLAPADALSSRLRQAVQNKTGWPSAHARLRSLTTEIPLCKVLVRVGAATGDTRTLPSLRLLPTLLDSVSVPDLYDRIAGQSVERLAALSDGIFAVAMTIMVLDLRLPVRESVHTEHDLWRALLALSPRLLMYMMSFLTLGIFWIGQQTQLNHLSRSNRSLSWIHIAFLFAVTLTPFSTMLLAEFPTYHMTLVAYWINLLLLGSVLYWSWVCALGEGLVKHDVPTEVPIAIRRRILVAQLLYAFGMLLCVFSTYWSIAVIVLVQLNYAIAPRLPGQTRR